MEPRYCAECDKIKIRFGKDKAHLDFISDMVVVKTETIDFRPPRDRDTLEINLTCFVRLEEAPPKRYSVDDLLAMIAAKKEGV